MTETISDIGDVLEYYGLSRDAPFAQLEKAVYRATDCGAFIEQIVPQDGVGESFGITLGSNIEGSDVQTEMHHLYYPFAATELATALDLVELEASELWQQEHSGSDVPDDHPGFDPSFLMS